MDIQGKLRELKEMHDKGLISPSVYAEQQKALLNSHHVAGTAPQYQAGGPARKGWPIWQQALALVLILCVGAWIAYKTSNQQGKDDINRLAAQTGIGTQVIPWPDRADTAVRSVIEQNSGKLASSIQAIAHPMGKQPVLASSSVTKLQSSIVVQLAVSWKGGLLGGDYQTVVAWEINEANHVNAKAISDSSPFPPNAKDQERLDDYFKMNVYPAFYRTITGSRS